MAAIFISTPEVLSARPKRRKEANCDKDQYQWNCPNRICKSTPKPKNDHYYCDRREEKEQISKQIDQHCYASASLPDHGEEVALDLHRRGGVGRGGRVAPPPAQRGLCTYPHNSALLSLAQPL